MLPVKVREDLELRMFEESDAASLYALTDANREYLREWLPWVDQTWSAEDSLRFIRAVRRQASENSGFAAGLLVNSELAGSIGLHGIDWPNRAVGIGYWLAVKFRGRGLMTDACRAIVSHAFYDLHLHRVEIRCASGNHGSCAIPKRLGFRQEGTLFEAQWVSGRFVDLDVYAMLAGEWEMGPHGRGPGQ